MLAAIKLFKKPFASGFAAKPGMLSKIEDQLVKLNRLPVLFEQPLALLLRVLTKGCQRLDQISEISQLENSEGELEIDRGRLGAFRQAAALGVNTRS